MYTQPIFDYAVFSSSQREGSMLEEGSSVCSVSCILWCSERGARGELICIVSEKNVFMLFALTLQIQTKSYDMNTITWLFYPLACKEVYQIIIFICTACL